MFLQETASSVSVSANSVVYSVLEFPKRASALSDVLPNDAEYANICYAEKMWFSAERASFFPFVQT